MSNRQKLEKSGRNLTKIGDLRQRTIFLLLALIVYRIGAHIPVPGINPDQLVRLFQSQAGAILSIFNMFSGGALSRFTIFSLGIMPYISSSIIMQLLTIVSSRLEALKKEGPIGQRKITQYTRYFTVVLAIFQAFGIATALKNQPDLVINPELIFYLTTITTLLTGTMFLMWLGEQITERGLGNGISIIIFSGIISGFPNAVGGLFELVRVGSMSIISSIIVLTLIGVITYLVVFIERGQRKIVVNYARRQIGSKIYSGQSSHLPLKINMSGVIPPIFSSSIILFLATILSWFKPNRGTSWISNILYNAAEALKPGQSAYVLLYVVAIVFFCFFYAKLMFNSKETAENLKKSGGFIPGIRPGEQTARYIERILTRLTLSGSIYVVFVCLVPEFLVLHWNVPFYFGGTSLMIIVIVTMEFMAQVQSYVMSQQYESLLKKAANSKGGKIPIL